MLVHLSFLLFLDTIIDLGLYAYWLVIGGLIWLRIEFGVWVCLDIVCLWVAC